MDEITEQLYREMHKIASARIRSGPRDINIHTTAIVHETYLRLHGKDLHFQSKTHYLAVAARAMRRLVIDLARKRKAKKRGGELTQVSLDEQLAAAAPSIEFLYGLHEILENLERVDPRQSQIVELRYFAGLTIDETAAQLGISSATVKREWRFARAWLIRELKKMF